MSVEIRFLGPEDNARFCGPILEAFGMRPNAERLAMEVEMPELNVRIGAFDGDALVGAAGAFDFRMSTPGGEVACSGLTRVAVSPTHRRKGVLRALMRAHLEDARARRQPIAALWASEGDIYGRFGYGLASLRCGVRIERDRAGFAAPPFSARLLDEAAALEQVPPLYERTRALHPGMPARSPAWWRIRRLHEWPGEANPLQRVLITVEGQPEAYALYRVGHRFDDQMLPAGTLHVIEAMGTTPRGTRAVWRYLLDIDLMSRVEASLLPVDHPLALLVGEPRRLHMTQGDALYVRVLDVPAALAARSFGDGDALRLAVRDAFLPDNTGVYRLEGGRAARTDEAPDLALDVTALGSALLGGLRFRQLADAGQAQELRPGALRRADALFAAERAPWCPEIF